MLGWRVFWSRRSRTRVRLGIAIILVATVVAVYTLLPANLTSSMNTSLGAGISYLASLRNAQALAVGWAVLLAALGMVFIFTPRYHGYPYLTAEPRTVPPVSVYVDAENQLRSEQEIRAFLQELYKSFPTERVDLMYFMDASNRNNRSGQGNQRGAQDNQLDKDPYVLLYRFGFRPIDVPHNPTGVHALKEAVDHEIAIHALERALLGPPNQTFILVTGDGDYLPLVFRLVALKHTVQIWANANLSGHYRAIKPYLPITVLNLAAALAAGRSSYADDATAEVTPALPPPAEPDAPRQMAGRAVHVGGSRRRQASILPQPKGKGWYPAPVQAPPDLFTHPGELDLFQAIAGTLQAHAEATKRGRDDDSRNLPFRSFLQGQLELSLTSVGYGVGSRIVHYWVAHLMATEIFALGDPDAFPRRGPGRAEDAARCFYAMAREAALAACAACEGHPDQDVTMHDVIAALQALPETSLDDQAEPLRRLLMTTNASRATHMRYFIHCARALELVEFSEVPRTIDMIRDAKPGVNLVRNPERADITLTS